MTKTALITGGASGIGRKTAELLASNGINIIINYRNSEQKAKNFVNMLNEQYGTKNFAVKGDVAYEQDCTEIVQQIKEQYERIDILIHNAGPYIHERKKLCEYENEEWNYIINGNLSAVFYLTKLILPIMRTNHWGRIVTIGFDRVETAPGWIYRSAFAAAKSGLASFTKTIALEEVENGVTANMVCPGDIISEWKEKNMEEARKQKDQMTPVGRPGTGEDIARVINFLCEEQSDFITGSIIPITGGKDVLGKIRFQ